MTWARKINDFSVEELLEIIGYDTSDTCASAYAFCRRFLPDMVSEVDNVAELVDNVGRADDKLLNDEKFLQVLKAVAYKYCNESKTPCKI